MVCVDKSLSEKHGMAAVLSRKMSSDNGPNVSATYSFSSQPRAIFQGQRTSKNGSKSSSTTGSLMNDKRLIKTGNIGTLVLHGQPQGGPSLTDIIRYQEARRRDAGLQNGPAARRGLGTGRRRDERVRTPPAVAGRKHYRVQTEPYLEEIRDRRVEADRAVQTDPLLDRPSTPLFVPSKTGADVATQIYEGDLFDFELESAPILEVLVGKTVEQSLLEVMEEEELETLKEHQRRFEERRQAELAEQQRLAERERRHVEEKERRMSQRRSALEQETETEAKVAASALAQSYLADMVPAVFSNLRQKGFFFNGVERDIEMTFMPWLRDAVEQELDKVLTGREVLDELILDAVRKRREELEQRPSLSARLPPAPLAEPAAEPSAAAADGDGPVSAAASAAGGPAGDEAEDDSEEEEADDSGEEEAAADEGSDDDDAGKGAEEGRRHTHEPTTDHQPPAAGCRRSVGLSPER
ncbi:radial spoke head protein 3 homolog B-like isoform X2 [Amphibalanus amphitrite]|uniref:radial spoke head protein 3 homolog B-like isoform X2 n=1 Tax=Amphibalanus amphitrite TaxID=1232801 RepID=UPI001C92AED5|nr:radial spoke head protein 3 homolog B-like isoform X2 [Amphibalanus amphitrite]